MEILPAYTREQAAEITGTNPRTISREIKRGNLRAFYVGRAVRISHTALLEYMGESGEPGKEV